MTEEVPLQLPSPHSLLYTVTYKIVFSFFDLRILLRMVTKINTYLLTELNVIWVRSYFEKSTRDQKD